MALVKYGGIITKMAGKIGGFVFQNTGVGESVRVLVKPKHAWSPCSDIGKIEMAAYAALWKNLTPEQRTMWNSKAYLYPVKNKLGETISISGYSVFVMLNSVLKYAGSTLLTDCPDPKPLWDGEVTAVTCSTGPLSILVSFTPSPLAGDYGLLYECGAPLEEESKADRRKRRRAKTINEGDSSPDETAAATKDAYYMTNEDEFNPGSIIVIYITPYCSDTGQRSPTQVFEVTMT
jgi:hypothetical protein